MIFWAHSYLVRGASRGTLWQNMATFTLGSNAITLGKGGALDKKGAKKKGGNWKGKQKRGREFFPLPG